jgi:hypothetical protein
LTHNIIDDKDYVLLVFNLVFFSDWKFIDIIKKRTKHWGRHDIPQTLTPYFGFSTKDKIYLARPYYDGVLLYDFLKEKEALDELEIRSYISQII